MLKGYFTYKSNKNRLTLTFSTVHAHTTNVIWLVLDELKIFIRTLPKISNKASWAQCCVNLIIIVWPIILVTCIFLKACLCLVVYTRIHDKQMHVKQSKTNLDLVSPIQKNTRSHPIIFCYVNFIRLRSEMSCILVRQQQWMHGITKYAESFFLAFSSIIKMFCMHPRSSYKEAVDVNSTG